jgi:hypothetical protein
MPETIPVRAGRMASRFVERPAAMILETEPDA